MGKSTNPPHLARTQLALPQPLYLRLLLSAAAGSALGASLKFSPRPVVGGVAAPSAAYPPLLVGSASDRTALTWTAVPGPASRFHYVFNLPGGWMGGWLGGLHGLSGRMGCVCKGGWGGAGLASS